jgi:hypothetical protein
MNDNSIYKFSLMEFNTQVYIKTSYMSVFLKSIKNNNNPKSINTDETDPKIKYFSMPSIDPTVLLEITIPNVKRLSDSKLTYSNTISNELIKTILKIKILDE